MKNLWPILFLIAAGQGVFLALLLALRQPKQNKWLSLLMLFFSLMLFHYVTFWQEMFKQYPQLIALSATLLWAYGPLLYVFVRQTQLKNNEHLNWKIYLHFLPFIIYTAYLMPFYLSSLPNKYMFLAKHQLFFKAIHWVEVVVLLFYSGLLYLTITKSKANKWLLYTCYLFTGYALAYLSFYVMNDLFHYVRIYDYYISVFMAAMIYFVGYIGFMKPAALMYQPANIQEKLVANSPVIPLPVELQQKLGNSQSKYKNSGLEAHHAKYLLEKLQDLMQAEQLYLNPELKMKEVADKMGISGHHLSQILNEYAGQNYADFINSYRIEAARQKLSNPQLVNEKIIAIAYDVGFNTKASFNAHFKKQTGMSPSVYKKQALEKKNYKEVDQIT